VTVPLLNNAVPGVTYADAFTVVFNPPRVGFSLNVANGGIFYQVSTPGPGAAAADVNWEPFEHFLLPGMQRFESPADEGFAYSHAFGGVRVRSSSAATPASVTVI